MKWKIFYKYNPVGSAFIQTAFNERNMVRLFMWPAFYFVHFFLLEYQVASSAGKKCVYRLFEVACAYPRYLSLCVLCVDGRTAGQWSRRCQQKEKASPATSKSVHRRTGLWAACRKYIWCWGGFERTGSNWFLSCVPLPAYLQSAGFKGDIWNLL